jgi:hypothetical protein
MSHDCSDQQQNDEPEASHELDAIPGSAATLGRRQYSVVHLVHPELSGIAGPNSSG